MCHTRSKHIEIQHHFVREKIESKEIDLIYYNTTDNVVGIFTKLVGKIKFESCRNTLGVVEIHFSIEGDCWNNVKIRIICLGCCVHGT